MYACAQKDFFMKEARQANRVQGSAAAKLPNRRVCCSQASQRNTLIQFGGCVLDV